MTSHRTTQHPSAAPPPGPRPLSAMPPGADWSMLDHEGSTVLRCRCVEASDASMRLCVPNGYGVAVGRRYELLAHPAGALLPGRPAAAGLWATVTRIERLAEGRAERLIVVVALDAH